MAELDRAMQLAEAAGNAAPLMTAIRLKCELNRLIVKQEEVGKPGEFDHLSDQDVRARREALAAIVKVSYSAFELTDIGRQSRKAYRLAVSEWACLEALNSSCKTMRLP